MANSELSAIDQMAADKQKIKDLFNAADYLSAWETGFLQSIQGRLDRAYPLSEKQRDCLDKMVAKAAERFD